jgi:hypothetical protein
VFLIGCLATSFDDTVAMALVVLRRKKADISDVESDKSKSGLIRLFDKLLLPRDSSKKEQKLKSRWSWGYGQGQQVKAESLATKNVPTKSLATFLTGTLLLIGGLSFELLADWSFLLS